MASSLALLSGANPRTCAIGPKVRLQPGTWTLSMHGLKDSTLSLHIEGPTVSGYISDIKAEEDKILVVEPSIAQIMFEKRGIENCISIFVSKVA